VRPATSLDNRCVSLLKCFPGEVSFACFHSVTTRFFRFNQEILNKLYCKCTITLKGTCHNRKNKNKCENTMKRRTTKQKQVTVFQLCYCFCYFPPSMSLFMLFRCAPSASLHPGTSSIFEAMLKTSWATFELFA
jgi:hypothetical protein